MRVAFVPRGFWCASLVSRLARVILVATTGLTVLTGAARAQWHRVTDPVLTPPSSVIYRNDALTLDVNPAGLGLLPSWSLAYLHAEADEEDSFLAEGDAVYFGTPLLLGLAGGLTLQSVRPDAPSRNLDHGMAAFGLAFSPGPRFGVGSTFRVLTGSDPRIDGLTSWDLGMVLRPTTWMDIGVTARDLFASGVGQGVPPDLDLHTSVVGSLRIQVFDALLAHAGLAVDTESRVGGRAGLGITVPNVGVVSALGEIDSWFDDGSIYRVMAGLDLQWEHLTLSGGGVFGEAMEDDFGWYAMARVEGARRAGLPVAAHVLDVRLDEGMSAHRMIEVAAALDAAARDDRVAGVALRLRETGMGLADAQELRGLIMALKRSGKPVVCHLEAASGAEHYACAAASQVWFDPAGSSRLMGLSVRTLLLGETLQRAGVRAEFLRIGRYKSAPEQYTMSRLGEPAREQTNAMLDDLYARMLADLAEDWHRAPTEVEAVIDAGPYLASEAVARGLAHGRVGDLRLETYLQETFGTRPIYEGLPSRARRGWGVAPRIGVVVLDGTIIDGDNMDIPLIGVHMSGGRTIARTIDAMANDRSVRAIVLRVDSPGGAVLASDQIWRAVRRARERKPVIASLGGVAASGGYYAASAADEIWADPATITGSIGIFAGKVDVLPLVKRLGVGVEHFQRGDHAGGESLLRPYAPDERAVLADKLRAYYRLFLARVAEGRDMPAERVHRVAQGHVWSGDAALELGLVDHLGGFAAALASARRRAGLGPDAELLVQPRRISGVVEYLLGGASGGGDSPRAEPLLPLPADLARIMPMLLAIGHAGDGMPLALMPYVLDVR